MRNTPAIAVIIMLGFVILASAQDEEGSAADLAKKLAIPIASLISVPFQNNTDIGIGDILVPPDGSRAKFGVRAVMILLFLK